MNEFSMKTTLKAIAAVATMAVMYVLFFGC